MNNEFIKYVNESPIIYNSGSYLDFRTEFPQAKVKQKGRPVRFWFEGYADTDERTGEKCITLHNGDGHYVKVSSKRIIFA